MANMKYGRIPAGLKVGDTIVWVNRDTVPHTATARDKSFDLRVNPGRSARMTLKKAGSVPFYCILHPAMRGTIAVAAN
jgi:plastocyanin